MPNSRRKANILFFILSGFFFFIVNAQTRTEKIPLKIALDKIEQQFNITFNYLDNDIKGVFVASNLSFASLQEALTTIKSQIPFTFKVLNSRFIALVKDETSANICGYIKDIYTSNLLDGASIVVPSKNTNTITDSNGYFSLNEVPADAVINIKFLGYKTLEIPMTRFSKTGICPTIFMESEVQELEEVVLVDYLTRGINKEVDGQITIEPLNFGILPGLADPDVLQAIQALPGIESIDETISNINIRGGSHDQNHILWDGIKMYQTGHFFGLISAFNPYLNRDIEVIKNGTSAKFNDGVSSTINIKTKDEIAKKFNGGIGFNLISADFFTETPLTENLTLQLSARRSVTDFLNTPTFESYFERTFQDTEITESGVNVDREVTGNENFFFYDLSAKLLYDLGEKDKFRISFIDVNNELSYDEFALSPEDNRTSTLDQRNIGIGGKWERVWNSYFTTELSGYFTQFNVDAVNFDVLNQVRLEQNNEVLDWGIKFHTSLKFNTHLKLESGYQLYEVGITNAFDINLPRLFEIQKNVLLNHAVFGELSWQKRNTFIRVGTRINYPEKFNRIIVEPRLNLNQKINNKLAINLQGELKSQYTSQIIDQQEDFLGVDNRRWVLADEENNPIITSRHIAFGADYNYKGWLVSGNVFYKNVDGITTRSQGFLDQNQFVNEIGEYSVHGLEFLLNKRNNRFSSWLSYTYGKNDYRFNNLTPQVFPNIADIRHSIVLAGTYTVNRFKLALGLNWRSGRPFTIPNPGNPVNRNVVPAEINFSSPNGENLDDFLRTDVSATYTFKLGNRGKATLNASVLNILNNENTINTYFRLTDTTERLQQVDSRSLGITPNLSFRVIF